MIGAEDSQVCRLRWSSPVWHRIHRQRPLQLLRLPEGIHLRFRYCWLPDKGSRPVL